MTSAVALTVPVLASDAAAVCAHCGQPVTLREANGAPQRFCCAGCESVYSILRDAGLEGYYVRRAEAGAQGVVAPSSPRRYADLDEPEFVRIYCRPLEGGLLGTELFLENVHCAACVWLVEKVADVLPGVTSARLELSRAVVRIVWDPAAVQLSRIAAWLDSIGYPCHSLQGLDRASLRLREDRRLLVRIGVAGAAAGNAMLLAIALYCGAFSDSEYVDLFRWASAVVALPSILWSAGTFYRGALSSLRARTPHMDLPIALGIAVGTASGIANTVRGAGEVYFDTITMVIFLLLVGRFLQHRQQRSAKGAEDALNALSPRTARLIDGDAAREVPVETVPRGALVEVRSGEHVPVDGSVVAGDSSLDVSLLTGESLPEEVREGATVQAGSVNLTSRIVVRAERTGRETRLAQLLLQVEEAAARRAPIVQLADRLSRYFVGAVLAIAAITVAALFRTDPALAVERAVALLVVTCPCALALATPLSITAALGRAARRGLMIKGGSSLEALAHPALIVFDKTGTLTRGELSVVDYVGDEAVKPLAGAAEAASGHPIARALAAAFGRDAPLLVHRTKETLGGGVEATVGDQGVVVGSETFVRTRATSPEWVKEAVGRLAARGQTPVLIAVNAEVRAVAAVADPPREDARACLETLRGLGHRLAILSGDQPAVVSAVAGLIGVPFDVIAGGKSPEEKLAFIEDRLRAGPVFMVGDGVNDAAALSAATVGIAVHGGAEASLAAAHVFATRAGLAPVVELVLGARRTLRVIRGNLARSLVYNLTVGTLAALGFVGPLLAAVLMPVSSLGVITSAYRSRTFGDD